MRGKNFELRLERLERQLDEKEAEATWRDILRGVCRHGSEPLDCKACFQFVDMSIRVAHMASNLGIRTVRALANVQNPRKFKNIGRKTVLELENLLARLGVKPAWSKQESIEDELRRRIASHEKALDGLRKRLERCASERGAA